MILKKISDIEIRQIAKLHYDLLGDGFLASFGEDFLYLVYQKINSTVGSTIIVYCAESRVVGFVAGGNGLKNIYLQLLKHPVQISKCVMPKLLQMSTAVKLYSLFTRKMGKNIIANKKINSELYSICVTKEYQGSGIAESLYAELCKFFKNSDKDAFVIVVGSELSRSQSFYRKQGAEPISRLEQGCGKHSVVFKQLL